LSERELITLSLLNPGPSTGYKGSANKPD